MPRNFLLYILCVVVLGLGIAWRITTQTPPKIPRNQQVILEAVIGQEPRINGQNQLIAVGDARIVTDLFPRYGVGERIWVKGQVESNGYIFWPSIEKVGKTSGVWQVMAKLRTKISQNIDQLLPAREATLVQGTVLGVDNIERSFREELVRTGTIHVVVVSGQNLMIVAGLFLALARYLGRRWSLTLAVLASFGYALLTGFEPPVVRASIMVLAATLAIYFGRESLPIWNLAVAALLIIFFWPQALSEVSFQLTFAATLGIMTLGAWMQRFFARGPVSSFLPASARLLSTVNVGQVVHTPRLRAVGIPSTAATPAKNVLVELFINNAAIATSAYLFTTPIILYYFGRVSILAPIANILIAEVVSPIMILGFLVAGTSLILLPAAQVLAYLAYVPAVYFVKVVEVFSEIPAGQVNLGKGSLVLVVGYYFLLFLLFYFVRWIKRENS